MAGRSPGCTDLVPRATLDARNQRIQRDLASWCIIRLHRHHSCQSRVSERLPFSLAEFYSPDPLGVLYTSWCLFIVGRLKCLTSRIDLSRVMNSALTAEIRRLGGAPTDEVWRWFLCNGPHGSSFTWSQTRGEPPGYVGVEHLQSIVAERMQADPSFIARTKHVVELALSSSDQDFLCRAIQVASVVGSESNLKRLAPFTSNENSAVSAHAKAAVFYLKRRLREGTAK